MKKISSVVFVIILTFLYANNVIAGDVPEGILDNDDAILFFGEVISYDEPTEAITVIPREKIKGDVEPDEEKTYYKYYFHRNSTKSHGDGELYLMAKYDEINPIYVFSVTSTDTATLEIKGISEQDMFFRVQEYLNKGRYEEEEKNRLERIKITNEASEKALEDESEITELKFPIGYKEYIDITIFFIGGFIMAVVIIGVLLYLKNNK